MGLIKRLMVLPATAPHPLHAKSYLMEVPLQRETIVFLKNRKAKNARLLNGGKCAV
jgi:hypothetical protein